MTEECAWWGGAGMKVGRRRWARVKEMGGGVL